MLGDQEDIHRVRAYESPAHAAAYLTALAKKECSPWHSVDSIKRLGSTIRALREDEEGTQGLFKISFESLAFESLA